MHAFLTEVTEEKLVLVNFLSFFQLSLLIMMTELFAPVLKCL